jgi:uncharacterized paraquat-inducible protein A
MVGRVWRVGGGRPEAGLRARFASPRLPLLRRLPTLESTGGGGCVMARMTSCKACGAMISAEASLCPRCGAKLNRIAVVQVGLAIMLAIAVLYALFERY